MINKLKSKIKFQAKLLRRSLRRSMRETEVKRFNSSINNSPILFANSFPKSGTHLLTQVLEGFPHIGPAVDTGLPAIVMYEGASGRERGIGEILHELNRFAGGDIGYGHLHAKPEIVNFLTRDGVCAYFILRDPRDVVISHVHYVTRIEPSHVHHRYYADVLQTFEERLKTSILGIPESENPFPNIAGRFSPFLEWLRHPEVLTLKYEDFLEDRKSAVNKVLTHATNRGFQPFMDVDKAVNELESMINPQRSPTFRQGKSGGWKTQFTPEHKEIFKSVAGQLLVNLGYEENEDW